MLKHLLIIVGIILLMCLITNCLHRYYKNRDVVPIQDYEDVIPQPVGPGYYPSDPTNDPGQRQNLSPLMLKLGVVYDDNYIIDQVGQLVGRPVVAGHAEACPSNVGCAHPGHLCRGSEGRGHRSRQTIVADGLVVARPRCAKAAAAPRRVDDEGVGFAGADVKAEIVHGELPIMN